VVEAHILTKGRQPFSLAKRPAKQGRTRHSRKRLRHLGWDAGRTMQEILAAQDMRSFLQSLVQQAGKIENSQHLIALLHQVALLQAVIDKGPEKLQQRALVSVHILGGTAESLQHFVELFSDRFVQDLSVTSKRVNDHQVKIEGPLAYHIFLYEAGSHLFIKQQRGFELICVSVQDMASPSPFVEEILSEEDRPRFPEIIRIHEEGQSVLDVSTGFIMKTKSLTPEEHRTLLLSQLPLPPELRNQE
jgi:hypothetical protein